jgi:hypothetical protein
MKMKGFSGRGNISWQIKGVKQSGSPDLSSADCLEKVRPG